MLIAFLQSDDDGRIFYDRFFDERFTNGRVWIQFVVPWIVRRLWFLPKEHAERHTSKVGLKRLAKRSPIDPQVVASRRRPTSIGLHEET